MKRVIHTPIHYEQDDLDYLGQITAFLAVIAYENPQMLDEILCRVAMGVGGFTTRLFTTEAHGRVIKRLEREMYQSLKENFSNESIQTNPQ